MGMEQMYSAVIESSINTCLLSLDYVHFSGQAWVINRPIWERLFKYSKLCFNWWFMGLWVITNRKKIWKVSAFSSFGSSFKSLKNRHPPFIQPPPGFFVTVYAWRDPQSCLLDLLTFWDRAVHSGRGYFYYIEIFIFIALNLIGTMTILLLLELRRKLR